MYTYRVLKDVETAKGKDHPVTARAVNGLATCFDGQGQFEQALELNLRAVAAYEKTYGNGAGTEGGPYDINTLEIFFFFFFFFF